MFVIKQFSVITYLYSRKSICLDSSSLYSNILLEKSSKEYICRALYSLSICLAVNFCIIILYLSLMAVGIIDDFRQRLLPTFPVSSFSTFSFFPSICCQALIMRNLSLLLSRLYNFSILSLS